MTNAHPLQGQNLHSLELHSYVDLPPVGWGSTYCFTAVSVGVLVRVSVTPITKGTPAFFFWEACFLFPRALAFDFCYDLDLCSQCQAVRAFFIEMVFP